MLLGCRAGSFLIATAVAALAAARPAAAVDPLDISRPCSVLDGVPCTPSHCGVYGPWPCVPSFPSFGQGLRLTVQSAEPAAGKAPEHPVKSLREMFDAFRACWDPPPLKDDVRGVQMTVRFSLKRNGELLGPPRVTYTSANADPETRRVYGEAIDATLKRCTPMPLSQRLGSAIAGRPIAIRFIDDRDTGGEQ